MLTLLEDKIETPLGPLWVIADEQSRLRAVEWEEHSDRMEQLLAIHYRQEGFRRVGCVNPGGLSDALRAWFAGDLAVIDSLRPPPRARRFSVKSGRCCAPFHAAR